MPTLHRQLQQVGDLLDLDAQGDMPPLNDNDDPAGLSDKERRCLSLMAEGYSTQRIARAFAVSIAYENALAQKLIDGLSDIAGLTIHGITDPERIGERVPTVSFTVDGIVPETIVRQMNAENIFLWSGHNYAWEIVHQLGIPAGEGVVRIGIAHYNTADEVDETLESVHRVIAMLRQQRA